jgi:hypothetical protein
MMRQCEPPDRWRRRHEDLKQIEGTMTVECIRPYLASAHCCPMHSATAPNGLRQPRRLQGVCCATSPRSAAALSDQPSIILTWVAAAASGVPDGCLARHEHRKMEECEKSPNSSCTLCGLDMACRAMNHGN